MKRIVVATLATLTLVTAVPTWGQVAPEASTHTRHGCVRLYAVHEFRAYASRVYKRPAIGRPAVLRMSRMVLCQHSPAAEHYAKRKRARLAAAHALALDPWGTAFAALPAVGQAWAHRTSLCESTNRRVTGGQFHSFFQWVVPTWHAAGGSGMPENASYNEQAVRAWRWHLSNPSGQWPNCGE